MCDMRATRKSEIRNQKRARTAVVLTIYTLVRARDLMNNMNANRLFKSVTKAFVK